MAGLGPAIHELTLQVVDARTKCGHDANGFELTTSSKIHSLARPTLGVSVAVWKKDEVLLIQRGRPPFEGSWSFPGGRVKAGETLEAAARRELAEETGLKVKALHFVRPVEIILPGHHIALMLFTGFYESGQATAMDDAQDVRWVRLENIRALSVTEGLENHARACWDLTRKAKA
jgi:8-oxo-dGTP diphosphatase